MGGVLEGSWVVSLFLIRIWNIASKLLMKMLTKKQRCCYASGSCNVERMPKKLKDSPNQRTTSRLPR